MRRKLLLGILVVCLFLAAGCGKVPEGEAHYSELDRYLVEKVKENYEDGTVEDENIAVAQICSGHFSNGDAEEIFAVCKILNLPHTAGLDKTVTLLLKKDSLEQVAYEEFNADDVEISFFQTSAGQSKVLTIGTTTFQGVSSQEIRFLEIRDGRWQDVEIEALEDSQDSYCFAIEDRAILVSAVSDIMGPEDITAVLSWNPDTGQFLFCPD